MDRYIVLLILLTLLTLGALIMGKQAYGAEDCIVKTIAYEASSLPIEAQILVGKTIRERMRVRHMTAREVVFERNAFSCWRGEGMPTQKRTLTDAELERAAQAWELSELCEVPSNLYARHDTQAAGKWRAMARVHKEYYAPGQTRLVYLGRYGKDGNFHDHFCEIRPAWRKYYKRV